MRKILILVDYRGDFQCSIPNLKDYVSMDLEILVRNFNELNYEVKIQNYADINICDNYEGWFVIYHSSEDKDLFYKSYIEDVCLYLEKQGAILLPDFYSLKAHHNKVFMELLRNSLNIENNFKSFVFGTYEEFLRLEELINSFPVIFKLAEGAGSKGVQKANDLVELKRIIKETIRVRNESNWQLSMIKNKMSDLLNKLGIKKKIVNNRKYTDYRRKFIVQPYYKLMGDCKVLRFGEKYYILGRKNRENDFRASGSGNYYQPNGKELFSVLNCARDVTNQFNENIMGLDIGYDFDCDKSVLIEFQFAIFLGPYTLQAADGWYIFDEGQWIYKQGKSVLEIEYSSAINEKIISIIN
ncbi:hypothetical protein HX057_14690 [Myroides odoratimimus]|uniref:hypothetical protein n=1 Tax=Myroides odoratimimus TaxID=76832 RepID=UPI002577A4E3|nr:hypothetical protein [Myroides odoratimimus]MDM1447991.1 hypothetical protein [Myroides odoratimimus]